MATAFHEIHGPGVEPRPPYQELSRWLNPHGTSAAEVHALKRGRLETMNVTVTLDQTGRQSRSQ